MKKLFTIGAALFAVTLTPAFATESEEPVIAQEEVVSKEEKKEEVAPSLSQKSKKPSNCGCGK